MFILFNLFKNALNLKEDTDNKSDATDENSNLGVKFWTIRAVKEHISLYVSQWWNAISFKTINNATILGTGNINTTPPDASETVSGLVNTTTQTFKGNKCIKGDNSKPTAENFFEIVGINNNEKLLEIGSGGINNPKFRVRGGQYGVLELSERGKLKITNTVGINGYESEININNCWQINKESTNGYYAGYSYSLAFNNLTTPSAPVIYLKGVNGDAGELANSVGIGTNRPLAKLDITSTNSGFLPPRMTEAQRLAITMPADGLIVYQNNNTVGLYLKTATGWVNLVTT